MFEELKLKNNELKDIIDRIEELTPWDREKLFNEIASEFLGEEIDSRRHPQDTINYLKHWLI